MAGPSYGVHEPSQCILQNSYTEPKNTRKHYYHQANILRYTTSVMHTLMEKVSQSLLQ